MSKPVLSDFKVKVTGDDPDQVANALEQISKLYKNAYHSSVIRSTPKGWHGFILVTREAA